MIDGIRCFLMKLSAVIVLGGAGLAAYWLWWPIVPYEPTGGPIRAILNPEKVIHPGEPILIQDGGFHNINGVVVDVAAQLQDGFLLPLLPYSYTTEYGQFGPIVNSRWSVPEFTPAGTYIVKVFAVFHVNPLRDITIIITTEPFQIAAR